MSYPTLLWVLQYYVERQGSLINPLVVVEFLVDMTTFLGSHTQAQCGPGGAEVELWWPRDESGWPSPDPPFIRVRFGPVADHPLTPALYWQWTASRRRVTRVGIRVFDADHPPMNRIAFRRSLPKGCHTLEDALTWLERLGIRADPDHTGYALVPDDIV